MKFNKLNSCRNVNFRIHAVNCATKLYIEDTLLPWRCRPRRFMYMEVENIASPQTDPRASRSHITWDPDAQLLYRLAVTISDWLVATPSL